MLLVAAIKRSIEQRADDKIIGDNNVLQAGADFFYKAQEEKENQIVPELIFATKKQRQAFRKLLPKEPFYTSSYPSPLSRAEQLEKRIAAITEK